MSLKRNPALQCSGSRRAGERGQALIETAVTLSMLLVMLLGAAEIGRIAWASIEVTTATRAAVQYGDMSRTTVTDVGGIQNAGYAAAPNISNLTITPTWTCTCGDGTANSTCDNTGCGTSFMEVVLTVNSSTTFDPLIHLPGLPSTYTIQQQAVQTVLSNND